MKIALYIDPYISPISTFYTKILLQKELAKLNYKLDIYIPYIPKNTTKNEDCYINKIFALKKEYNIIWDIPNPEKYDILLLIHIWSKKWHNGDDMRKEISNSFNKLNKKILCLKFDTTLEHRYINDTIIYGINTEYKLNLSPRWILPNNAKTFIFPQISNLSFNKEDILSKIEFYNKYKINKNKKIIIFFVGRFKKWYNNKSFDTNVIQWFFNNLSNINILLNNNNYQLIFKLHRSDGLQIIKNFKLNNLIIIDQYDTHEAIKYSNRSISYCTSMVYELYLYNLPVLELFEGIYYPGWISDLTRNKQYNSPLKDYNNGKDLIYGKITSYKELINNSDKILSEFINTDYNIKNYNYCNNHPIFGNSYYSSIQEITNLLITEINK
jgi:hypothetical protein